MSQTAFLLKILLLLSAPAALAAVPEGLRYLEPGRGTAQAVVVDGLALAHTSQVFATGPRGEAPSGDAAAQVERTLENLSTALGAAGSGFDRIVRIHAYVADPSVTAEVERALARRFNGPVKPAVTFMDGKLPVPGALVAMDAIAAVPPEVTYGSVARQAARGLPAEPGENHVAVLPAGPAVFISGRAERGELQDAARDTMARLGLDLEAVGLTKSDVVQVKAWVTPIESADIVRREIRAFFGNDRVPPLIFVEWVHSRPTEIELVAAAPVRSGPAPTEPVEYITPPGDTPNVHFTRIVRANHGKLVYTAGLYGRTDRDAEPQIREILARLRDLLTQAGSDFDHMAKATYYVTDDPSSTLLNTIRRELYNPERPPAASKIPSTGTGRPAKTITLDMIAVAP